MLTDTKLRKRVKEELGETLTLPLRLVVSGPETLIWNSGRKGVELEVQFSSTRLELLGGDLIASQEGDTIVIRSSEDLSPVRELALGVTVSSFTPFIGNLLLIATQESDVQVWNWKRGEQVSSYHPKPGLLSLTQEGSSSFVTALLRVSGERVVLGFSTGSLSLWLPDRSGSGTNLIKYAPHSSEVTSLLLISGVRFVSASLDRFIRIWDTNYDQALMSIHTPDVVPQVLALDREKVYLLMEGFLERYQILDTTSGELKGSFGKRKRPEREIYAITSLNRGYAAGLRSGKVEFVNVEGVRDFNFSTGPVEALLQLPTSRGLIGIIARLFEEILGRSLGRDLIGEMMSFL